MTAGSAAVIVGMFTPRAQRLGDLAAGTYAERTRTPKLPDVVPLLPPGMEGWASVADVARVPDRVGRRMNQFVSGAAAMFPPARARVAAELTGELAPFVSPYACRRPGERRACHRGGAARAGAASPLNSRRNGSLNSRAEAAVTATESEWRSTVQPVGTLMRSVWIAQRSCACGSFPAPSGPIAAIWPS